MTAVDLAAAFATLPPAWRAVLPGWTAQHEAVIVSAVRTVSGTRPIAPADPFRALRLVGPAQVRVVIFGQDPYPGAGHADGLAFSAPTSGRPSLRRIFDVMEADRPGWRRPRSGRLDAWAEQGVLLLNPTLTVEVGRANSHTAVGWHALTSMIALALVRLREPPVFMLWGAQAQAFMDAAVPQDAAVRQYRSRHPSHDTKRQFMAGGSHFAATADRIDWWRLTDRPA